MGWGQRGESLKCRSDLSVAVVGVWCNNNGVIYFFYCFNYFSCVCACVCVCARVRYTYSLFEEGILTENVQILKRESWSCIAS